jgi:hypothetical protein
MTNHATPNHALQLSLALSTRAAFVTAPMPVTTAQPKVAGVASS